jgi:hypothetical protein
MKRDQKFVDGYLKEFFKVDTGIALLNFKVASYTERKILGKQPSLWTHVWIGRHS